MVQGGREWGSRPQNALRCMFALLCLQDKAQAEKTLPNLVMRPPSAPPESLCSQTPSLSLSRQFFIFLGNSEAPRLMQVRWDSLCFSLSYPGVCDFTAIPSKSSSIGQPDLFISPLVRSGEGRGSYSTWLLNNGDPSGSWVLAGGSS